LGFLEDFEKSPIKEETDSYQKSSPLGRKGESTVQWEPLKKQISSEEV